jgi:hypothetical protein
VKQSQLQTGVHDRRRLDTVFSPITICLLTEKFNARNASLLASKQKAKVSAEYIYMHILPAHRNTLYGQTHRRNAVLKSRRAANDFHKYHPDVKFACAQVVYQLDVLK